MLHQTPNGLPLGFETDKHPGHWHLHYITLPAGAPTDFTPYPAPGYAEHTYGRLRVARGPGRGPRSDHAKASPRPGHAAQRGVEAGT